MANLKENNINNLQLRVNKDEYWDFFIDRDSYGHYSFDDSKLYDECLISSIDLSKKECYDGDSWIYSSNDYSWENALSVGDTLYNISYTGLDNGLFQFRKDRILNQDFWKIYQEGKFELEENDTRLKLHAVSGSTLQYEYPLHHSESGYTEFNGGFYQGFFKTECDKYYILPSNINDETWQFDFTLKKCNLNPESHKTLNDKYPENKGIFFYIGTRSENKWTYYYDKDDKYGLEECFELSPDDYVDEEGHIDKSDYIIGNFYDMDVEMTYTDKWDMFDEYSNFNYYDETLYKGKECDIDDLDEFDTYVDYGDVKKPKIIDETLDHETLSLCSCGESSREPFKYVLKPYRRGCGCPIRYRREVVSGGEEIDNAVTECDIFGEDGYIGNFDGLEEDTDYVEPEMELAMFDYETDTGFSLEKANQYYFFTDNKFLLFDRTKSGYTIKNWVDGTEMMYYGQKNNFKGNLFIYMNRTSTGYNVNNIDELRNANINDHNPYKDLYNNALAFRITDDGEIGYRYLTIDCELSGDNKVKIEEGYSFKNVIPDCEWCTVSIQIRSTAGSMKFYFYVNGKLVYITKDLPNLNLRALDEIPEKQEGVPFNISLGGGTQGLAEMINHKNYMLNPTRVYPLEKYFAGSFIGYIKDFKFHNCEMEYLNLKNNAKIELSEI